MTLHAGCVICDICGKNLSLAAMLDISDTGDHRYNEFDLSLDGGATIARMCHACMPCKEARYVEKMSETNSIECLPEGPLKKALAAYFMPEDVKIQEECHE